MIPTMPDIREAILVELKRRGWSNYKLVQMLKGKRPDGTDVTAGMLYQFLAGKTTINSADLGLIFDALELEPRRRRKVKSTPQPTKAGSPE